jgi:hypothetical protein
MGDYTIDPEVLNIQAEIAASLILDFGITCLIYYPPQETVCPNCFFSTITQRSNNIYKPGGPIPFTNGSICPYCNGAGIKKESATESITVKAYADPKDWVDIGVPIKEGDSMIQIWGFADDIPKLRRAEYVELFLQTKNYWEYKGRLEGKPVPHGFKKNLFIAFIKGI